MTKTREVRPPRSRKVYVASIRQSHRAANERQFLESCGNTSARGRFGTLHKAPEGCKVAKSSRELGKSIIRAGEAQYLADAELRASEPRTERSSQACAGSGCKVQSVFSPRMRLTLPQLVYTGLKLQCLHPLCCLHQESPKDKHQEGYLGVSELRWLCSHVESLSSLLLKAKCLESTISVLARRSQRAQLLGCGPITTPGWPQIAQIKPSRSSTCETIFLPFRASESTFGGVHLGSLTH